VNEDRIIPQAYPLWVPCVDPRDRPNSWTKEDWDQTTVADVERWADENVSFHRVLGWHVDLENVPAVITTNGAHRELGLGGPSSGDPSGDPERSRGVRHELPREAREHYDAGRPEHGFCTRAAAANLLEHVP
jgi:hypothetical protein